MKKLLLSFILVFGFSLCEGQSWVWGKEAVPNSSKCYGDPSNDHCVAIDALGNVYITSSFRDTLSFGSFTVIDTGYDENTFIAKYDANGNILWVQQPTLKGYYCSATYRSVAVDAKGNSYVAGGFHDTISLGSVTLRNKDNSDAFLVKYDVNGNLVWAKQSFAASPSSSGYIDAVTIDSTGEIYASGTFADTITFGSITLKNKSFGVFLVKYDSSGNVIWAKQDSSVSTSDGGSAYSIALDNSGGIYITGYFDDTIWFKGIRLIENPSLLDVFITKYDTSGNVLWAKQAFPGNKNSYGVGTSIALDGSGDAYVTGSFKDSLTFGGTTLISLGHEDVFLVKYSPSGNVLWAKQGHNTGTCGGYAVVCDTLIRGGGNLIILRNGSPAQIIFGSDTFSLLTSYTTSTVLLQFDSSGKVSCGNIFTEGNEDDYDGLGIDHAGKYVYLFGDLDKSTVFGTDTLIYGRDVPFVARWQPCNNIETSTTLISTKTSISLFPNPNTGAFTLEVKSEELKAKSVEVYNVMGQKVFAETLRSTQDDNPIDIQDQPNGIYLYRVIDETGKLLGEGKFVIAH